MPDLTPDAEVMTAAEWKRSYSHVGSPVWYIGTLAALEERERLLGEVAVLTDERDRARHEAAEVRRLCEADASLGALVRRIREEKPFAYLTWAGGDLCFALDKNGLTFALDSLVPPEPKVAPSGWLYKRHDSTTVDQAKYDGGPWTNYVTGSPCIPPIDREFVARLLASNGEGRGDG